MRPQANRGAAEVIELRLERLISGGAALGFHAGKATFVPKALPGERIRARLVESHASYARAELLEILEPSPLRRAARCPYFQRCGGCDWQMLGYPEQLEAKRLLLRDALRRFGGIDLEGRCSLVPAAAEWSYRDRIQLHVERSGAIGFFGPRSHRVVDIERCAVASPAVAQALTALRDALAQQPLTAAGLGRIDIEAGDRGPARVALHPRPRSRLRRGQVDALLQRLLANQAIAGVSVGGGPRRGDLWLQRTIDGSPLRWAAGGFAQASGAGNRRLVELVLGALAPLEGHALLELHAGHGNFTLALARRARSVVAIESGRAAEDARANVEAAGRSNVVIRRQPARAALQDLLAEGRDFSRVLLDPTRSGARELVEPLCGLGAARLVYVACDAPALARDLRGLIAGGYALERLTLLDLFPQTAHFETIAVLNRAASGL